MQASNEPGERFSPKIVHVRRERTHWSITVPRDVVKALGWEKGGKAIPILVWIDIGFKDGVLVKSFDLNDENVERLRMSVAGGKVKRVSER